MSETRRSPREVPNTDNVTTRLAELANVFVGETTGLPFPMSPVYEAGHRLNEREARVMNSTRYARIKSTANSNLTRGAEAKLSRAEQVAWLTKFATDYKFTDAIGSEWSENVVQLAASRVFFAKGKNEGKRKGEYKDYVGSPEHVKDAPVVARILTDPALADRYEPLIRAEIDAIFAETREIAKRAKSASAVDEVEV